MGRQGPILKGLVSCPEKFGLNPGDQLFSNYSVCQNHLEGLLRCRFLGPKVCDSVALSGP